MTRPIGGYLPLRLPGAAPAARPVLATWTAGAAAWLLHNARSALHALWLATKPRRVWLPAYVCREVASAVPPGTGVAYFPVGGALAPDVDFLSSNVNDGEHVLAVDYFGRPAAPEFTALVRSRPGIGWIEDRAQALDPGTPAWGDWVLYSPRKLLGVPDGGILVAHRKPPGPLATVPPDGFDFVAPALARFEDVDETDNDRWYAAYVRAERAMRIGVQAMSRLSTELLARFDADADGAARRGNYAVLHGRLREWALWPDGPLAFAPLGFPLRVKSAAALATALAGQRIFAARHWADLPSAPAAFPEEHRLALELVTLPCDYRYDAADMHRVADAVVELLRRTS